MKKIIHKTIHQLFISTGILLITFHTPLSYAESNYETEYEKYIKKIERSQKLRLYNQLHEGSIVCNEKTVIAPKIIRDHLSCRENNFISKSVNS